MLNLREHLREDAGSELESWITEVTGYSHVPSESELAYSDGLDPMENGHSFPARIHRGFDVYRSVQ